MVSPRIARRLSVFLTITCLAKAIRFAMEAHLCGGEMKSVSLVILALTLILAGCAKAPESAPALPPVFNQLEYDSDLQRVLDLENQLAATGHQFSLADESKIKWDDEHSANFIRENRRRATNQQRMDALDLYYRQAETFLKKYRGDFNLRNTQGFSNTTRLQGDLEKKLKQKAHLAKITLAVLQSSPIDPEPEYGP